MDSIIDGSCHFMSTARLKKTVEWLLFLNYLNPSRSHDFEWTFTRLPWTRIRRHSNSFNCLITWSYFHGLNIAILASSTIAVFQMSAVWSLSSPTLRLSLQETSLGRSSGNQARTKSARLTPHDRHPKNASAAATSAMKTSIYFFYCFPLLSRCPGTTWLRVLLFRKKQIYCSSRNSETAAWMPLSFKNVFPREWFFKCRNK